MGSRTRSRSFVAPVQGSATRVVAGNSFLVTRSPITGRSESCQDVIDGTRNAHGLLIQRSEFQCEGLQGDTRAPGSSTSTYTVYNGLRPSVYSGSIVPVTLPNSASDNLMATQGIARSNPSRPHVDLGVTIGELREAPQLLFQAGRKMFRNGANWWLGYQFGWTPLVNDLLDLLDLQEVLDNRVRELESLHSKGGLRRRISLPTVHAKASVGTTINTDGGDIYNGIRKCYSTRKSWVTTRWKPTRPVGAPPSRPDLRKQARRAALGLTVDPSTAWNLIPWSWLFDWAGSGGDFLEATRNTVGASLTECCVMQHTTHFNEIVRTSGSPYVKGGGGWMKQETKRRSVVPFVMPEMYAPILGARRLSILWSLGVMRIPRHLLR